MSEVAAQHTPGPWAVEETPNSSNQNYVVKVGRCRVSVYTDNDEADARLIAAAPKMLAALRRAQQWIAQEMLDKGSGPDRIHNPPIGSHLHAIDAAIAEAAGSAATIGGCQDR